MKVWNDFGDSAGCITGEGDEIYVNGKKVFPV